MANIIQKLDPAVGKPILVLVAGILWLGVGIMLCSMAAGWLINSEWSSGWIFILSGFIAAMVIHHFGFLRIVDKNLGRIRKIDGKFCVFGFMPWKSYLIIAVMMTMGILLRHSSIPKECLSFIYIAVGLSLVLSSIRYFRNIFRANEIEH